MSINDKDKSVIQRVTIANDDEKEFAEFIQITKLHTLLERCQSDESARSELGKVENLNWSSFSIDQFDSIRPTVQSPVLGKAMDLWRAFMNAKAKDARLVEEFDAFCQNRVRELKALAGDNFPRRFTIQVADESFGPEVMVELTTTRGFVLTFKSSRFTPGQKLASPQILVGDTLTVTINDPLISGMSNSVKVGQYAERPTARLIGIGARIMKSNAPFVEKKIFLISPDPGMINLDMEPVGNGSKKPRRLELSGPKWSAVLRLQEDPRLLVDTEFSGLVASVAAMNSAMCLSSITVKETVEEAFDLDLFLSYLFFITQVQFLLIETQYLDEHGNVVGLSINSFRESQPQRYVIGKSLVTTHDMRDKWNKLVSLGTSDDRFSNYQFTILIHAFVSMLKQPIQKGFVDCYQILDTMAKLHPDVPKTKMDSGAFSEKKKKQGILIEAMRYFIKSLNMLNLSVRQEGGDWDTTIEEISKMLSEQRNDFSVVQSVKKLLDACNIVYDRKDKAQSLALDLRHKISHNLASVQIATKEPPEKDKYKLADLVEAHRVLIKWIFDCISYLLERGFSPPSLNPSGTVAESKESAPVTRA